MHLKRLKKNYFSKIKTCLILRNGLLTLIITTPNKRINSPVICMNDIFSPYRNPKITAKTGIKYVIEDANIGVEILMSRLKINTAKAVPTKAKIKTAISPSFSISPADNSEKKLECHKNKREGIPIKKKERDVIRLGLR